MVRENDGAKVTGGVRLAGDFGQGKRVINVTSEIKKAGRNSGPPSGFDGEC